MTDYYKVLGLEQGASLEEVRKAYREYAAHFHPDKHGGSEFFKKRFQEIQEAYEYLTQNVEQPLPEIVSFYVSKFEMDNGEFIDVSWDTKNAKIIDIFIDRGENYELLEHFDVGNSGKKRFRITAFDNDFSIWLLLSNQDREKGDHIRQEIIVKKKTVSQTSYNGGRNNYSKIETLIYDIESSIHYRTWKKGEEENSRKLKNVNRFLEVLTWISGVLIFIVALRGIALEGEMGWIEAILISLVVAFAAPAMFFGLIIQAPLTYMLEKDYSRRLTFCRHDGQYIELDFGNVLPIHYNFKQMATWNVKVKNEDVPLTSFMQGGGTLSICYFINKMTVGIDTFDFPQLSI